MKQVITSELVEAYRQCQRKAFFMLRGQPKGVQHEYEQILMQRADKNRNAYLQSITSDPHSGKTGRKNAKIELLHQKISRLVVTPFRKRIGEIGGVMPPTSQFLSSEPTPSRRSNV